MAPSDGHLLTADNALTTQALTAEGEFVAAEGLYRSSIDAVPALGRTPTAAEAALFLDPMNS